MPSRWHRLVVLIAIVLGLGRIVGTYDVFNETWDEGVHIAAGMELLDRGTFTYEPKHPPLARVAVALGPWLAGIRSQGVPEMWGEGRAIIHAVNPDRTLFLARLGIVPFFVLACAMLWLLTRRLAGEAEATGAVILFTLTPIVLAHASVATTDMALLATFTGFLVAGVTWLDAPTRARSVWLGIAGAAVLTAKMSSVAFVGLTAAMVLPLRWWWDRGRESQRAIPSGAYTRGLGLTAIVGFVVVWGIYGFQVGRIGGIPVPLTALWQGVRDMVGHNEAGHASWLLGEAYTDGRWLFFPVGIMVKAPLTVLAFGVSGAMLLARRARERQDWRLAVPLLAVAAVLAPSLPARINIGVRHVLPVFMVLSLCGGVALMAAWRRATGGGRAVVALLAAAGLWSTARVHPDYLAYFNELAGAHPERVLVDSDLDWGQDLRRLRDTLHARGIDAVTTAYFGSAVPEMHGIPVRAKWRRGGPPVEGWFVVSQTLRQRGDASLRNGRWELAPDAFDFLDGQEPVARVGRSLLLYHLAPAAAPSR